MLLPAGSWIRIGRCDYRVTNLAGEPNGSIFPAGVFDRFANDGVRLGKPDARQGHLARPCHPKRPFSRDQRTTIVYGMLVFVLIVVVLQLWLLTATMNAWLGGDDSVVWPAAAVSAGGLALNVGLLTYLGRIERTRRA